MEGSGPMNERPDLQPGFWPEYLPPASHVSAAVQYPLDARWQNRVLNGMLKDDMERRKRARALENPS